MQQALDAIYHLCNTCNAGPGYNPQLVADALEAIEEALEDPIEKQLNESVEERLQRVEKGLAWLTKLRESQEEKGTQDPVKVCEKSTWMNPDVQCDDCNCWKKTFPFRTN